MAALIAYSITERANVTTSFVSHSMADKKSVNRNFNTPSRAFMISYIIGILQLCLRSGACLEHKLIGLF